MMEEINISIKKLKALYKKYSLNDLVTSLFCSSLWLPNISSPVKHQLYYAILSMMEVDDFETNDKITNYQDFKKLLDQIYSLSPSFHYLEDYVPESDWGQIKYFFEKRFFQIFYGNELSNIFDHLMRYELMIIPFEDEIKSAVNKSPKSDLINCLTLQDQIITFYNNQFEGDIPQVNPGYIEIPSEAFWKNTINCFEHLNLDTAVESAFLENYSFQLGTVNYDISNIDSFTELVMNGEILPHFFLKQNDTYYPILPRRYSSILVDSWGKFFKNKRKKLFDSDERIRQIITGAVANFIKQRVSKNKIFTIVSVLDEGKDTIPIVFVAAILTEEKIILFYLAHPDYSIDDINEEVNDVSKLLTKVSKAFKKQPYRLHLHIDKEIVEFRKEKENVKLIPEIFYVLPQLTTERKGINIPESFDCYFITLDELLYIIDESESAQELSDFTDYLERYSPQIDSGVISVTDLFASFKESFGVLIEGALEPDGIFLDPNWGSNYRYESLTKFWKIFPERNFIFHPRSWNVIKEGDTRIRIDARGFIGCALYTQLVNSHIFINSPFENMTKEQALISNLIIEIIEWGLSHDSQTFKNHPFFSIYTDLQIIVFPSSLVQKEGQYDHVKHLIPEKKLWESDYGFIKPSKPGIRLVFNDSILLKELSESKNRSIEIDLLCELLDNINTIVPFDNYISYKEGLDKEKSLLPRFKIYIDHKKVSFPDFVSPQKPDSHDFKRARKVIAELALKSQVDPNIYQLSEAKYKINILIESIVKYIDEYVHKFNYANSISYLLTRIGALNDQDDIKTLNLQSYRSQEVNFDIQKEYSKQYEKYRRMHKNYRYIIEKFVQNSPEGTEVLSKGEFKFLIALIDWLFTFYAASDSLHYEIDTIGIEITSDYKVDPIYNDEMKEKHSIFAKEISEIDLGIIGNKDDKISVQDEFDLYMDDVDQAFQSDLHFSLRRMCAILDFFTYWPIHSDVDDENSFYRSTLKDIQAICVKNIRNISQEETERIINFLTLKSDDVLRLIGSQKTCKDLPVWEYTKRFARYNIRPLIKIGEYYYWEPYSVLRSLSIWTGTILEGSFPHETQSKNVKSSIRKIKKHIEDKLPEKAFEIINEFTPFVEKNIFLHKRDKQGNHSTKLGDYDVLAYVEKKNLLLNIECKDILQVHCLKDAKTLRDRIFGKSGHSDGFIGKIKIREKHLKQNYERILNILSWPKLKNQNFRIISIYLSRRSYWWTKFPPIEDDIKFLRIDLLRNYMDDLIN